MSKTIQEVIREVKYLKIQRQNQDDIIELKEEIKSISIDLENLAQASLDLVKKINSDNKEVEDEEVEEEDEEEEEEEEEESQDAIIDPQVESTSNLEYDNSNSDYEKWQKEERRLIELLVPEKYHKREDDELSIIKPEIIDFDLPKTWKIKLQIKYIPLINDRYVGVFDYEYSTGGHFSPIIIQTKHHKSLEDLKNHFIKIFLEMVQDDRTRGEHMTSLGKNASGIFKYFEEYTKLLIPDENKEVEEKPKIKPKKKPNKKEIKKDSSKGILEEYQEIFKKINCQDACKFETLINLFEKFNNKVRSIKNYPDRELKRPFVFNWSKSKFVFPCKNFVQFEADFLEFFKKMSRKKAYLFDLTKV